MDCIITINMDNDAFRDNEGQELARILKKIATDIEWQSSLSEHTRNLYDLNGNRVGKCEVEGAEEDDDTEPHDQLCENCLEELDQCLDPDCTERDHHPVDRLCSVCESVCEEEEED